jgi:endoglucanase
MPNLPLTPIVLMTMRLSLFVPILAACAIPTATPLPQPTFAPISAEEQAKQLGRGVNFGNALEAPTEGEWGMMLEERFFDLVKEGGFNTIRLPTRWSAHAAAEAPYTLDAKFFERVDWAIANAMQRGLNIVVNMHHYDELMVQPDAHRERFIALWRQIAERYKDQPAGVLFELMNEPHDSLTPGTWNRLAAETLAVVRASNPTRNVVIGGGDWNSVNGLMQLKLPADDPHLIATFHYYLPFQFTHQGADWVAGSQSWLGTEWKGSSNDRVNIDFDFDKVEQWARDNQRPVWMGEFGAYSKADLESRARWTDFVARDIEQRGMSWAYWEFGVGFGVYDRTQNAWNEAILKALAP